MENSFSQFGPVVILGVIVIGLVLLVGSALTLWMLIDCLLYETNEGNQRLIWALILILVPFGFIPYYFMRKRTRPNQAGPPPIPPAG